MGRPKISFTGAGELQESGLIPVLLLRHFPPIIEAALYAKTCQYLYLNAGTAVGDSFTTQVIGGILNKSGAASQWAPDMNFAHLVWGLGLYRAGAMTELLRRSRRLEIHINNSSNQLVEEFQSRNVVVLFRSAMRAILTIAQSLCLYSSLCQ